MTTWAEIMQTIADLLAAPPATVDEYSAALATISEAAQLLIDAGAKDDATPEEAAKAIEGAKAAFAKMAPIYATLKAKANLRDLQTKNAQDIANLRSADNTNPMPSPLQTKTASTALTVKKSKHFDTDETAFKFGQIIRAINGVESAKSWVALNVKTESSSEEAAAGMFIPDDIEQTIIRKRNEASLIRKIADVVSMSGPSKRYRKQVSGPTYQVIGEGSTITTTEKIRYEDFEVFAKQIAFGFQTYANLDKDATINLADEFVAWVAIESAKTENLFAFKGDGTSTYAGNLGATQKFIKQVTDAGGTWTTDAHKIYHPSVKVATGSTWASIVAADIDALAGYVDNVDESMTLAYVTSRAFYYGVMQPLARAANSTTGESIVNGIPQGVWNGFPVYFSQHMPAVTAVSDIPVLFGDFKAIIFGDREGMTIESDKDITTQIIKTVATQRFGILCADFGTAHVTAGSRVMGAMAALATKNS